MISKYKASNIFQDQKGIQQQQDHFASENTQYDKHFKDWYPIGLKPSFLMVLNYLKAIDHKYTQFFHGTKIQKGDCLIWVELSL